MNSNGPDRSNQIIKYNLIGIGINLVLSLLKMTIGVSIHSRAVILDSVNGFSDMLSAVITILAAWASKHKASKAHPLGLGRLEYVSSLLITMIIMYMGVRSIISSVGDIIHPGASPDYNRAAVIIMIASVVAKICYGLLLRIQGKRLHSAAMIMTGTEGLGDAVVSMGILGAMATLRFFSINIEPYLCILISLLILYTGVGMLRECLDEIVGSRPDSEFEKTIKRALIMEPGVLNVTNLVIHSYGENVQIGSVDIEVEGDMKAADVTRLSRRLIRKAAGLGLTLTSVGITGSNLGNPRAAEIWDRILYTIREYRDLQQAQLFTVDFEDKVISFYVVPDYACKSWPASLKALEERLGEMFPDMKVEIHDAIDI